MPTPAIVSVVHELRTTSLTSPGKKAAAAGGTCGKREDLRRSVCVGYKCGAAGRSSISALFPVLGQAVSQWPLSLLWLLLLLFLFPFSLSRPGKGGGEEGF